MSTKGTIAGIVAVVVGTTLLGCRCSGRTALTGQREAVPCGERGVTSRSDPMPGRKREGVIGMPNPATVYCLRLGYEIKVVRDKEGNEYGICVFPDGDECSEWSFYRGECNQERSYCKQHGYELKDLRRNEGWFRGAVCIDKTTRQEVGTVYDLMDMGIRESLPESPGR